MEARQTEQRYFSAVMAENRWRPQGDGLAREHFPEEKGMYRFFQQYARKSDGGTPPLSLVMEAFPAFEHRPGVDRRWLADRLMLLKDKRTVAGAIRQAMEQLEDDQVDAASEVLRGGLRQLRSASPGVRIQDYAPPIGGASVLPSLYKPISGAGGLRRGSYSVVLARPNVGKSWRIMQHAVDLAVHGEDVVLFSMEMDMEESSKRLHMLLHGKQSHEWDWDRRNKEADKLLTGAGGSLVIDIPSHIGQLVTAEYIARRCGDGQVAVIDHLGLMHTPDGRSAREDHVVISLISRSLKEISQSEPHVTVLAAAQLNRTGSAAESRGKEVRGPELEHIGGSDKIGQDVDVAFSMRRNSARVVSNYITKNRYGPAHVKWYTRFDYDRADFGLLDAEEAYALMDEDRERQEGA